MKLLRDWRRRIAGGTAVAVLVPVGIVASTLALGLGSGFSGLGVLGQALTGPQIPDVEPASARAAPPGRTQLDLLAAMSAAAARAASPAASRAAGRPAAGRRRAGNGGGGGGGGSDRRAGRRPPPGGTRPPDGGGGSGGQPTPPPTEPPGTVRQVGERVKSVTNQVPVAGEPAGQVVDIIVETAEQLPLP